MRFNPQREAAESWRAGARGEAARGPPASACPQSQRPCSGFGSSAGRETCCQQLGHLSIFSQLPVMAEPALSHSEVQLDFPSPRNTVN